MKMKIEIKPNKECNDCDVEYTCFTCEADQVRNNYPSAVYTDDCQWVFDDEEAQAAINQK